MYLYLLWLNENKNIKTGINNSADTTASNGGGTLSSNEMAAVLPQHAMSNLVSKLEVALDESSDSAATKLSPTRHSSQLTLVRNELQSIFSQKQAAWSSTPLTPVQARDVVMDPAMGLEATRTMTTMTTTMGTTTMRSVSTTSPTNLPLPTTSSSTLEPRYAADRPCAGETSSFGLIIFEDTNKVSTPNRETGMHGEAAAIANQVNSLLFSFAFSRGEQGFSKIVCASGDRGVLWATLHISAHSTRAGCQLASDLLYEAVESQRRVFSLQNEAFPVLGFVPMECEQQEEENVVNSGGNDGNENNSRPGNAKDGNTVLTAASTPAPTAVQEIIATPITNANDGVALLASQGNETRAAVDGEAAQMTISNYVIIAGSSLGVAGVMLVLVWAFRKVNRPRERAPWESLKDDDYMGYHSIDDNALRFGSRANFLTPEMMAQMAAFNGGGSGMGLSTVDSSDYGDGSIKTGTDLYSGTESTLESNTDDGTDAPPHQPEQTWSSMFANDLLVNGINRHGFGKERNTGSSAVGPPIPKSKRPTSHMHGFKPPGRSQFQQHSKAKGVRFSENPSPSQKLNDWTAGRERASPLRHTRRGLPTSNGNRYHDNASIAKRAAGGSPHYAQLTENRMRRGNTEYFQVDQLSANPHRSAPVNPQLYEHRNGVMDDLNLDFFETETLVGQSRAKSGKVRGIVEQAIVEVDENGSNVPFPFRRSPTGLAPAPPYPQSRVSFGVNATRANDLSGRTSHTVAAVTASQLLQAQQDEISYTFESGTSGGGGDNDDDESYSLIDGDEGANMVPAVQMQSTFTFGRTESSEGAQLYGDSTADDVAVRTGIHGRTGTRRIRKSSLEQPGYMLAGGDTLIAEFDADPDAEALLPYSMDDVMSRLQSPGRTPLGPNSRPGSVYSVEGMHDLKSETNDSELEFPTEDIEELWAGLGQAQAMIDRQRATGAGSPWMMDDAEGVYATATTAMTGVTGTRRNPLFEE